MDFGEQTAQAGVNACLQQFRITQPGELDDGQCGATYASIAASRTPPWLLSEWGCPVAAKKESALGELRFEGIDFLDSCVAHYQRRPIVGRRAPVPGHVIWTAKFFQVGYPFEFLSGDLYPAYLTLGKIFKIEIFPIVRPVGKSKASFCQFRPFFRRKVEKHQFV